MPGILIAHKVESFEGDRPSKYEQTQICSNVPNVTFFLIFQRTVLKKDVLSLSK